MLRDRQTGKCNEAFVMGLACAFNDHAFVRRHVCNNRCRYFSVAGETNKGLIEINRVSGCYLVAAENRTMARQFWATIYVRYVSEYRRETTNFYLMRRRAKVEGRDPFMATGCRKVRV